VDSYEPGDFGPAARFVARLAGHVLSITQDEPLLLNVNVPALPEGAIKGVQITRMGRRIYRDTLIRRADPRGRAYYWIGGEPPTGLPEEGTDIGALAQGYISVTPILLDLTDYAKLALLRAWKLTL
jgi:5'-nucleotidase